MTVDLHYSVAGAYRPPREDIELAAEAVDAGFEGIWIGDHFLPWLDNRPYAHHVLPWFGALMNEIPDVPVGTNVMCPMMRYRPPLIAQAIGTLDNMYPGRFHLGVGTGEALNEAHFMDGEWPDWDTRAEMLVEAIDVMRELWGTDEYIAYDGDHFSYDGIKLYTNTKEKIPIHWAAWAPKSAYNAGRYADHLIAGGSPDTVQDRVIKHFENGLDDAGRDRSDVEITMSLSVNAGDPDDLVDDIRANGEFTPDDTELDNPDPRDIQRVANERLPELSDEEIVEGYNMTQDPDDVIDWIEDRTAVGVDRIIVGSSNCGDPRNGLELFEDHVFPALES